MNKTLGLTPAMREALESRKATGALAKRLYALGLIDCIGYITPRGHAALAAPKMTRSELCSLEGVERSGICFAKGGLDKGWIERDSDWSPWRLTTTGHKALNDVRAAIGSEEWKP